MIVVNIENYQTVVNKYVSQLRDITIQSSRQLFRHNLQRIGQAMAYEVSKTLNYSAKTVTTPLGQKLVTTYNDHLVIGTVLRAGLSFHEGFLQVFDEADCGFVAAYREEGSAETLKIRLNYMAAPHLEQTTFLLVDPMLATGGSLEAAYHAFLKNGTPSKLHICVAIASQQGIDYLQKIFPSDNVTLWVGSVDPSLNEQAYIVPGLGDAGDLSFGEKL